MRAVKKGSEDGSVKVKRKPQPKKHKRIDAEALGLERHAEAPQQGDEGAPTTRTTRNLDRDRGPSFVGQCFCFVQCSCMLSGGAPFVATPRFVFLLGFPFSPLPLLGVAFTPAFIL